MMIAALVIGYFVVALVCVYCEARFTGDAAIAPMWLVWPVMVPIALLAILFAAVGRLGERHSG